MRYKIYYALKEDMNSGWVWIGNPEFGNRIIVKIENLENNKSIYAESLFLDDNFVHLYNQSERTRRINDKANTIVLSMWYRTNLGIANNQDDCNLSIKSANNFFGKLKASFKHPQIIVRIATGLGIISIVLGFIGLILGVLSLIR